MLEAENSYTTMVMIAMVVMVEHGDDEGTESIAWLGPRLPGWPAGRLNA